MLGACCAAAAGEPGRWVVWDEGLRVSRGRLVSIEGGRLRLVDEHGLETAVADAVAMLRSEAGGERPVASDGSIAVPAEWEALVTLTDGQRWEAEIVDDVESEDLELRVRRLGRVTVPLDVVRSVVLKGGGPRDAGGAPADQGGVFDRVVLDNGDILSGTVLAIGGTVEIEGDDGTVRVERGAVRRIGLVNPGADPPPVRVWLGSGSVFGARSISGEGAVSFVVTAPTVGGGQADLGRVEDSEGDPSLVGVEFAPGRLVPLSSLEVAAVEAQGGRRWTPGPVVATPGRLGQAVMEFPGPMLATLGLPRAGVRATGEFTLGEHAGAWADCEVRLEQGGAILWEGRLNAASPSASFAVELGPERVLSVRVLAGEYGPVQDRVELRLGWLLLAGE